MSLIILEGKVDVASIPNPPIGSLLLAYDLDGFLKQKNDAGVVSSVSGSLPLASVLSLGNTTGANSIVLNTGSSIKSQLGNSELKLDSGNVFLSTDGSMLGDSYLFMGPGGNVVLNAANKGILVLNTGNMARLSWSNSTMNSLAIGSASFNLLLNSKNVINVGDGVSSGSGGKLPMILSSDGATITSGIINTVVLGGSLLTATMSNSVYVSTLYVKSVIKHPQSLAYIGSNKFGESFLYSSFGSIGIVESGNVQGLSNGILIYDTTNSTLTPNTDSNIVYVGSRNASGLASIKNSVVIGGVNMAALNSNTVYLGNSVNINNRYTLPSVDGANGELLRTDGSGNVSWDTLDGSYLTLAGLTVSGIASFTTLNFSYLTLIGLTVSGTSSFNTAVFNNLTITDTTGTPMLIEAGSGGGLVGINTYGGSGAASSGGIVSRFSRGTKSLPLDVGLGDRLGYNLYGGWAGANFRHTAGISAMVDLAGTISSTSLPTYFSFLTTPNNSVTRAERLRICSSGNILIGTTTDDTVNRLQVNGGIVSTNLVVNFATFSNITATSASFSTLFTPSLNVNTLNAVNGVFSTLASTNASFGNMIVPSLASVGLTVSSTASINYAHISDLIAITASFGYMSATGASFSGVTISSANISNVIISTATISNTAIANAVISNIGISMATVSVATITSATISNIHISSATISNNLSVAGTMSINRLSSAPTNNSASKLLGLSGSQLVEVTQFVNSVTSSNNSVKIAATGSNFTYDFTLGFTSSTNTVQISAAGAGLHNLQIATDSKSTLGSVNFVRSGELFNELLLKQNLPTGYIGGLTLSIMPGDNTKFNIAYGGFLVTDFTDVFNFSVTTSIVQLPLAGLTGLSPLGLTTSPATYVALDKNLNVVQSVIPFSDASRRTLCLVGAVIHSNLTIINTTNQIVAPIIAPTNQLHDLIKTIGFMNISGNVYSPINAATSSDLTMKKSAGEIWGLGINGADYTSPHKLTIPSQATFSFRIRKSTTPLTETGDLMTLVGNLNYETIISSTNSTLTAIPGNKYGVFHGTLFQSGLTRFQYPQRIYDTLIDGVNSSFIEDYTLESNIRDNGVFRFYLVIRGGTTNFTDPTRFQFIEVGKFGNVISGGGGASLTFANLIATLGYTPESQILKQDSLAIDGTGTRYPTVDAVNANKHNNLVIVKSLANLPTPVGGIIKALDNITYQISGSVNIGTNQIERGVSNLFRGIDKSDDRLIYTGTSSMFIDGATGSNRDISINGLTLISTTGSIFNMAGTSSIVEIKDNIFASSKSVGSLQVGGLLIMRDNYITANANGILITGNNTSSDFVYADNYISANTGTYSALNILGTFSQILVSRNSFKIGSGQTGITYSSSTTLTTGNLSNNAFTGVGTYISGFSNTTTKWVFSGNQGIPNRRRELFIGSSDMNGIALSTPTTAAASSVFLSDTGARFISLRGGAAQDDGLAFTMQVPSDYFSGGSFDINFTTDTTVNNVKFFMGISKLNVGSDFGTLGETGLNIVTAGVTQYLRKEVTITPITTTFSSGDIVIVKMWRDPDDVADTATNISAYISNLQFVYNSI